MGMSAAQGPFTAASRSHFATRPLGLCWFSYVFTTFFWAGGIGTESCQPHGNSALPTQACRVPRFVASGQLGQALLNGVGVCLGKWMCPGQ